MTRQQIQAVPRRRLELWAGPECSVVRVGDETVDEIELTGHAHRASDLDRLAELGVSAVRYPVLWERIAPHGLDRADWRWTDARLALLRGLGIRVIAGLVHHGSGPPSTNLLSAGFANGLGQFARAVAQRYPWLEDFTPINEPVTTARFSALYGHWYPHARSDRAFVRALLVECAATAAAMRAIRTLSPTARLVQTEDAGATVATSELAHQAEFENERRYLSFDLLLGRGTREHPLRKYLEDSGATQRELDQLVGEPCPPDLLGLNYYVTSDRFLDHRVTQYPPRLVGGNGRDTYVDLEAVRISGNGIRGHTAVLDEAWARYHTPLAITEVHLGCGPEDQIRWLAEAWTAANDARTRGVDVRAVTAWSAFGAVDWDSLLTKRLGAYEPGLFDVRGTQVRPTALARVAKQLASGNGDLHPMAQGRGWWRRSTRLSFPPYGTLAPEPRLPTPSIIVTGAGGQLGRALVRACMERELPVVALTRKDLDITDAAAVRCLLGELEPYALINAAGYASVNGAERDPAKCWHENVVGPACLAGACASNGVRFATFSSHLVFDGQKLDPYRESDVVAPLATYGQAKAEAERSVLANHDAALVVRTSQFFGPDAVRGFVRRARSQLVTGRCVRAPRDLVSSATYLPDLAHAVISLLIDEASGVWHLANGGAVSMADLARAIAARVGGATQVEECAWRDLASSAARPTYSALTSTRGALLPPLENALTRYCETLAARKQAA